jgi:hypothetical protein
MKFTKVIAFFLLSSIFAGCAGYQVGSTLPEEIQTVFIKVENKTEEPSIEVEVMKALRAETQMDGRLILAPEADADVVLNVSLSRFNLRALAYDKEHGSLAREYRMVLTATSVLSNAETDEVIVESSVLYGESDFSYAADLTSAKRGALPGAARDLARKVVSLVTTAW